LPNRERDYGDVAFLPSFTSRDFVIESISFDFGHGGTHHRLTVGHSMFIEIADPS